MKVQCYLFNHRVDHGVWKSDEPTHGPREISCFHVRKACATPLKFTNVETANSPNAKKNNDSKFSHQGTFLSLSSEMCAWVHGALNLPPHGGMEMHYSILLGVLYRS